MRVVIHGMFFVLFVAADLNPLNRHFSLRAFIIYSDIIIIRHINNNVFETEEKCPLELVHVFCVRNTRDHSACRTKID